MSAVDIINQLREWKILEQVILDGGDNFYVYDEEDFELHLTTVNQRDMLSRFLGVKHPLTLEYNQCLNDLVDGEYIDKKKDKDAKKVQS